MESRGNTRREILKSGAAAGAAAMLAGVGFNRMASAAHHENHITQLAIFGFNADKKDEAVKALADLAKKVEENEPGVLAYIPHTHQKDDVNQVIFFEIYKDEAALQNHSQQPYMAEMRTLFASGVFKPPLEIKRLDRAGGYHR